MTEVHVQLGDGLPSELSTYAGEKVTAALRHTAEPILYARARVDQTGDNSVTRAATARVEVDLNGRVVHAHAQADTPREAIDLIQDRLRVRIERLGRR